MCRTRSISEETWEQVFVGLDNRAKGLKFEKIMGDVLAARFGPDIWARTLESHDKGRDYEVVIGGNKYWAECKAHEKNLSYHILSPHLIMARIHKVNVFLIFSLSPLNKNAVPIIANFQRSSKEKILCYDGDSLDQLILSNKKLFYSIFGKQTNVPISLSSYFDVYTSYSTDAWIQPRDDDFSLLAPTSEEKHIELKNHSIIRLDLAFKHTGEQQEMLEISASSETKNAYQISFITDDSDDKHSASEVASNPIHSNSLSVELVQNGLTHCIAMFKPTYTSQTHPLPQLEIRSRATDQDVKKTVKGTVTISNLYQINIIGVKSNNIIRAVKSDIMTARAPKFHLIHGASGVGKSRILEEIATQAVSSNYKIRIFDLEYSNADKSWTTIRNVLDTFFDLPGLHDINNMPDEDHWDDSLKPYWRHIKENAGTKLKWKNIENLVDAALKAAQDCRILLIIDNLQYANNGLVEFLQGVWDKIEHATTYRIQVVASYNTDMSVSNTAPSEMFEWLKLKAGNQSMSQTVTVSELPQFTSAEVEDFVSTCITGKSQSEQSQGIHKRIIDIIKQKVEPKPLNLWQSMFYLIDGEVLVWNGENLSLQDLEQRSLLSHLNDLPETLVGLLKVRWNTNIKLAEKVFGSSAKDKLRTAVAVGFTLNQSQQQEWHRFGVNKEEINFLTSAGFLTRDSGAIIKFFHQQLFHFFASEVLKYPRKILSAVRRNLNIETTDRHRYQQYFLISRALDDVSEVTLHTIVDRAEMDGITEEYGKAFSKELSEAVIAAKGVGQYTLKGGLVACEGLQRWSSFPHAIGVYKQINYLLHRHRTDANLTQLKTEFFLKGAATYLAIRQDNFAYEWVKLAEASAVESDFQNQDTYMLTKGMILYRKASIEKNFSNFNKAEQNCTEALDIFKTLTDKTMCVKAHFDLSEILWAAEKMDEAKIWLEKGIATFEANREQIIAPTPSRYFISKMLLNLLEKRFYDAALSGHEGLRYAAKVQDHFWETYLRILLLVEELLSQFPITRHQLSRLLSDLKEAESQSMICGNNRKKAALEYLRGKIQLENGNHAPALDSFRRCFETLAHQNPEFKQMKKRESTLTDIVISCRLRGANLTFADLQILDQGTPFQSDSKRLIIKSMAHYLDLSETVFKEEARKWIERSPFNNGHISILLP